jgi:hypothetical protein
MSKEEKAAPVGRPVPDSSWGTPRPEVIPPPTYFPAATAFGATFLLWGFVTSPVVLVVGLIVLVVSIGGWLGEMRRDG